MHQPVSSFMVVTVCEIGLPFSDRAGFLELWHLLPTGLENFWRRGRLAGAVWAGTRFFILLSDVSERSPRLLLSSRDSVALELE